ncbi:hypothetical protein H1R20_g4175, partial [Candolleomyces eurysporus]
METVCEQGLGVDQEAQVLSGIWVDAEGSPIFVYFGRRVAGLGAGQTCEISKQYTNRTQRDLDSYLRRNPDAPVFRDGLNENLCLIYQLATQALCSNMTPNLRMDRARHEGINIMQYEGPSLQAGSALPGDASCALVGGDNVPLEEHPAYDANSSNSGVLENERAGVLHLVHGWIQQGQPEKGLFISGDVSRSSSSLAAAGSYYFLTQEIADVLAIMFETVFPDWYAKYRKAFDAGVWVPGDPGPFLGRAIIYKLQGRLHRDRHDLGPSACFGVGSYTGGAMKVLNLREIDTCSMALIM